VTVDTDDGSAEVLAPSGVPELLRELVTLAEDDPRRREVRDRIVESSMPLVIHLALRFRDRGETLEDLIQVGAEGLLKAVDRFEPERGLAFSTYATPTIIGEIRRHLRDRCRGVRQPRRLQEVGAALGMATADLTQSLGRAPTVPELAERLGVAEDLVLDALEAAHNTSVVSLDAPVATADGGGLAFELPVVDDGVEMIDHLVSLRPLIEALPERERRILSLRFFDGLSQAQIAERVGISQMHVSRLLAQTLRGLRQALTVD
jgi:RNA polymerase sigma-B factor